MSAVEPVPDGLSRWARVVVCLLVLLAAAHTALLLLWLAPRSPVRDAVGGKVLSSYVDPYFKQGEDSLGIGSNRVDESLQIRASVRDTAKGKQRKTPWIDVTSIETTALRGDIDPARSHQAARRLATTLNFAMLQLKADQREIVAKAKASQSLVDVRAKLITAEVPVRVAFNFSAADEMTRRFASLWLGATLDDVEVVQISYRVGRREVPDVSKRGTRSLQGTAFTWIDMGWREPYRGTPEAREAFSDYVRSRDG